MRLIHIEEYGTFIGFNDTISSSKNTGFVL